MLTNLWYERAGGRGVLVQVQRPPADARPHLRHRRASKSRLTDFRYVHFDNDYYERPATDGTGISDHDPPLATFEAVGASASVPGNVTGTVPATLALTIGTPASSARSHRASRPTTRPR